MNYSVGCAFNTDELFMNFPFKKLSLTCEDCKRINGDSHRDVLVKQVFRECLKLVLNDIIDNNVTFNLPTGAKKCNMHMKRVRGESFKNLRRAGKWKDVDILESNFTGYEIGFYMYGKVSPRVKNVYVNKTLKDRITENTNKGMQYGDSNKDKTIKDYYEAMFAKFPQISQSDMKRILNFSWKSLYLHNSYGGDTFITDKDLWCYIGYLKCDSIKHFLYYIKKLTIKLRVLYKRKKIPWDGYYYFALSQRQYDQFIGLRSKRGRPKKNFTFERIYLYQILDECKIQESSKQYIFRIPYIDTVKLKFYMPKLTTSQAELILTRDSQKFKDILVYENDYDFL